ncbi:DNA internalization-related competence protein ComEC/Rec2 [Zooshikella ganghwensis]|uniref:DNA internalization-related competence protein ComEC/Rec2 n=1 Tax=Zooshikella ganghwensis TaxID=202772 RepID=A0A4P9VN64_9GAMM|nr:DNA internalization-related competence protein ComEC/Rec2 [Zooshikella ganghwensis]RDH44346.1 DNA internalization-related competence protein ComEC/Rec2 [Zooshikella ganghwensis]
MLHKVLLAFIAGCIGIGCLPVLPSLLSIGIFTVAVCILCACVRRRIMLCLIILAGLLGLLRGYSFGYGGLAQQLPKSAEQQVLQLEGEVVEVRQRNHRVQKLLIKVHALTALKQPINPTPEYILLSDYQGKASYQPTEVWRWRVKLKRPHGFASPGSWDYEGYLFQKRVGAVGYIRQAQQQLTPAGHKVSWFRWFWPQSWRDHMPPEVHGMLTALLLGDKQYLQGSTWEVFRSTGTAHLLVVSGLHIGLMATLGWLFVHCIGRLVSWPWQFISRPRCAAIVALAFACSYALLAGFSLPTQRALIMVAIALSGVLLGVRFRPVTLWLSALAGVIAWDPLAWISSGFWFSFIATGILLWRFANRPGKPSWSFRYIWPQCVVMVAVLPILYSQGQSVSWLSPVINMLAIPYLGLILLPMALLSGLLTFLSLPPDWAAMPVSIATQGLLLGIHWSASLITPKLTIQLHGLPLVMACLGALWILLPSGFPGRWLGWCWWLPLFWTQPAGVAHGGLHLAVLDVGQGLAVVIKTEHHLLVYDTGKAFSPSFSAAKAVLIPYLQQKGWLAVDTLLISHGDLDHSGGMQEIIEQFPVSRVLSGTPAQLQTDTLDVEKCKPGQHWQWDNIRFQILAGGNMHRHDNNAASCVLKVSAEGLSVLLPGDIGQTEEHRLVAQYGNQLKANVLIAAHHGSKYSSSMLFLKHVQPTFVVFSAGYLNPFKHPAPAVLKRINVLASKEFQTSRDGTVEINYDPGLELISTSLYRRDVRHYWSEKVNW